MTAMCDVLKITEVDEEGWARNSEKQLEERTHGNRICHNVARVALGDIECGASGQVGPAGVSHTTFQEQNQHVRRSKESGGHQR